jgi:polar amino acid transport system substrate-binding protein
MKVIISLVVLLVIGCIAAAGCTSVPNSTAPATTTIPQETRPHYVIGVDADFPPFSVQDSSGNFSGFDIDAARRVAEIEGFDVTFVAIPWDSAISSLESGKIDMIWSGMTVSPERSALVNFSVPYYRVTRSIAVREGSGLSMEDFNQGKIRIGAQAGSTEQEWIEVNLIETGRMPEANISLYKDISGVTGALVNGTVDATLVQAPTQARAIQGKPLVIIGNTMDEDTYAVAIRNSDTRLQAVIDHGLSLLMSEPVWQEMKAQHGLQ